MEQLWFVFWFFLPAGLANASPVFINKIPLLNQWGTPLDFGKKWRGRRLLGDNKTWRGLVGGSLVGAFTGLLIYPRLAGSFPPIEPVALGALLGFGALAGDALESFLKRQIGKKPGDRWFPFDQIDYIIGGIIFSLPIIRLPLFHYFLLSTLYFLLHIITSYIGYLLKLKDKPI